MKPTATAAEDALRLVDPRPLPGHHKSWFPLYNGRPAPEIEPERPADWVKLQMLICHYHLNRLFASLTEVRKTQDPAPGAETSILQEIDEWLQRRDRVAEAGRLLGIVAEPIRERGFTRDLHFTTPETGQHLRKPLRAVIHMTLPPNCPSQNADEQVCKP